MDPTLKAFLLVIAGGVVVSLFAGTFAFVYSRIGQSRNTKSEAERRILERAKEDVEKEKEKVVELQREVAIMKAAAIPITAAFQAMLVSGLRHHHAPALDEVLDKMTAGERLTPKDLKIREEGLAKRQNDPNADEAERIKAKILPDIERLAELEKEEGLTDPIIETVLVSKPGTRQVTAPDGSVQREDKGN